MAVDGTISAQNLAKANQPLLTSFPNRLPFRQGRHRPSPSYLADVGYERRPPPPRCQDPHRHTTSHPPSETLPSSTQPDFIRLIEPTNTTTPVEGANCLNFFYSNRRMAVMYGLKPFPSRTDHKDKIHSPCKSTQATLASDPSSRFPHRYESQHRLHTCYNH
jgi:hypothetical protein